jgi:hypothetical protein
VHHDLKVEDCFFKHNGAVDDGGAIDADSVVVDILFTCTVLDWSEKRGGFLFAEPDDPNRQNWIYDNSFVADWARQDGIVYFNDGHIYDFQRCNFTRCEALNSGSAFKISKTDAKCHTQYVLLYNLTGNTGIDSFCSELPDVHHCNFYHNQMSVSWGVLCGRESGMNLKNCIFNSNSRDIVLTIPLKKLFILNNCVFSGAYEQHSEWYSIGDGCHEKLITHSWIIIGVTGEAECPTNSPTASSSFFYTASQNFISSQQMTMSENHVFTHFHSESPRFDATGKFQKTDLIAFKRGLLSPPRHPRMPLDHFIGLNNSSKAVD